MNEKFDELKRRLGEVVDLARVSSYLDWDQQALMPAGAAALRAEESATLERLVHERFTSPEIGHLLDDLSSLRVQEPLPDRQVRWEQR